MSLRAGLVGPVPEQTVRVARAAFPKGCPAMRLRDAVGPVFGDAQFAGAGYATSDFTLDWDTRTATCPRGGCATRWTRDTSRHGQSVIKVQFAWSTCQPCPVRELCTRGARYGRTLTLRPRTEHEALNRARHEQQTQAWQQKYQPRAGIEGTLSHAVRVCGARHARYHGHPKTRLQHQLTAAAINLTRLGAWLTGTPLVTTRTSRLAALKPAA